MLKVSRLILIMVAALLMSPVLRADEAAKPAEKAADAKAATTAAKAPAKAAKPAATGELKILKDANALMGEEKYDEAIKAYDSMGELKSKKNETFRLNNWGLCLISQKKFTEAIPVLEKSIAVDANNDRAYRNLGSCYVNTDEIDKAIDAYKKAVEAAKANASEEDVTKSEARLKDAEGIKQARADAAEKKAAKGAKKAPKAAAGAKDAKKADAAPAKDDKKADTSAPATADKK